MLEDFKVATQRVTTFKSYNFDFPQTRNSPESINRSAHYRKRHFFRNQFDFRYNFKNPDDQLEVIRIFSVISYRNSSPAI